MIENNIYCEISEAPRDYRLRHSSIHIHLSVNVNFYIIRCINKCTLYNIYIFDKFRYLNLHDNSGDGKFLLRS